MSNQEEQSEKVKTRGLNVRVVQEQKVAGREEVFVNYSSSRADKTNDSVNTAGTDKIDNDTNKISSSAAKIIVHDPEEDKTSEKKEDSDAYFETLRLDVDNYAPKDEAVRIIVRDVAEMKPEIENIEKTLPQTVPLVATVEPDIFIPRIKITRSETFAPQATIVKPEFSAQKDETLQKGHNVEKVTATRPVKTTTKKIETEKKATHKIAAKDLKEREISKAIRNASKLPENKKTNRKKGLGFGWMRIALAVSCVATAFFAVAYFVNMSSNDMSLKVAAIQSGIEAIYPSYIPREFALSDITASNGKVIMNFKSSDGSSYSISEENTAWDSTALLNNYIKEEYGEDYTVVKEQGLTLYMGTNWEAWVNGGLLYKLKVNSGSLTKKQLKTIAASL